MLFMTLRWLQCLARLRAMYGVSIVIIWGKIDRVITALHCISQRSYHIRPWYQICTRRGSATLISISLTDSPPCGDNAGCLSARLFLDIHNNVLIFSIINQLNFVGHENGNSYVKLIQCPMSTLQQQFSLYQLRDDLCRVHIRLPTSLLPHAEWTCKGQYGLIRYLREDNDSNKLSVYDVYKSRQGRLFTRRDSRYRNLIRK